MNEVTWLEEDLLFNKQQNKLKNPLFYITASI